jgi:hypothetical protein
MVSGMRLFSSGDLREYHSFHLMMETRFLKHNDLKKVGQWTKSSSAVCFLLYYLVAPDYYCSLQGFWGSVLNLLCAV